MGSAARGRPGDERSAVVSAPGGGLTLLTAGWFDSHSHLFDCDGAIDDVVARARRAHVTDILVAGIDVATSERALALAARPGLHAAVGVHPNSASDWGPAVVESLRELAERAGVVAIGETGLDFYRRAAPEERQRAAFRAHIALAREHDKALVIHTRDSVDAAVDELERDGPARAIFHCWSGDERQLERALAAGAYVSFAGNVTFKRNAALRTLAGVVPDDRLLVETDAPYLAPEPHRGRPNEPAHVALVGEAVGSARGMSSDALAGLTSANARRLFGL